jgi:nucleotide-binding universal stress UspA family protein
MKKILVPTDFSDCANNAAILAMSLAEISSSEIHFLHILNTPMDWVKVPKDKEKNYPEIVHAIGIANSNLSALMRQAESVGLKAKEFLVFSRAEHEIIDHLIHHHHDFVVMGSHGSRGVHELFIGSNAQRVVRLSPVPILVVKEHSEDKKMKTLLFATDFSSELDAAFIKAKQFAKTFESQLKLVFINVPARFEESSESEKRINAFQKRVKDSSTPIEIRNALNAERGILGYAEEIEADMVALTTHGRSGFMENLSPSVTENVVNHCSRPVLTFHV